MVEDCGTKKATEGISSRWTKMCMYVSVRYTLFSKVGTNFGSTFIMQFRSLWKDFTKRMASLGAVFYAFLFRPLQEKS